MIPFPCGVWSEGYDAWSVGYKTFLPHGQSTERYLEYLFPTILGCGFFSLPLTKPSYGCSLHPWDVPGRCAAKVHACRFQRLHPTRQLCQYSICPTSCDHIRRRVAVRFRTRNSRFHTIGSLCTDVGERLLPRYVIWVESLLHRMPRFSEIFAVAGEYPPAAATGGFPRFQNLFRPQF